MSIYSRLYFGICESRKSNSTNYVSGSGLHRHHIKPRHSGGEDDEENYTYLTIREHKIVHFLLWKMHGNVNDLRSMHMLGANLSVEKRRIIGKWCYENKIGCHAISDEQRLKNLAAGRETQKLDYETTGNKNNFYYWSTEIGRRERSSIGGKKGGKTTKERMSGFFSLSKEEKIINAKNAAYVTVKKCVGIHSEEFKNSLPERGKKLRDAKKGIFGLSKDQMIINSRKGGIKARNNIFVCRLFQNRHKSRKFQTRDNMLYFAISHPEYYIDYHYAKVKGKTDEKWLTLEKFFTKKERDSFIEQNKSYTWCESEKGIRKKTLQKAD